MLTYATQPHSADQTRSVLRAGLLGLGVEGEKVNEIIALATAKTEGRRGMVVVTIRANDEMLSVKVHPASDD